MNYVERLENITVIGAAGKMGSGIVLLTALEMADLRLDPENASRDFVLHAVDISHKALGGLMAYLRGQVQRAAEKKAVLLRTLYSERADLIENEEIIRQYTNDVLSLVRPTTQLEAARESSLVFEAVNENLGLKIKLLTEVKSENPHDVWFLSNTSSIPICELNEKAGLEGRIIGCHFYNPPAVQKLVEVIRAEATRAELADFTVQFAKKLRKTVVPSNDVAGFIGNGHFMRDALHGISEVERLTSEYGFVDAVYMINKVSQEFLIRPMGIFQLIDYVGLDVCQCILQVMNQRLEGESLHSPLIDKLTAAGIHGGQYADGSQKDGILKYEKGRPAGIYDSEKNSYVPVTEIGPRCDERLGAPPGQFLPWKNVITHPDRKAFLDAYFQEMTGLGSIGADLAVRYGRKAKDIGLGLVSDRVAAREEDVNTVLLTGFYHAYGPINNYFD